MTTSRGSHTSFLLLFTRLIFIFFFFLLIAIILVLEEHSHKPQNGTCLYWIPSSLCIFPQHCPQLQFPLNHVTRATVRYLTSFALKCTVLQKKNKLLLVQSMFQKQVQADLNLFVDSNCPDRYINVVLGPM